MRRKLGCSAEDQQDVKQLHQPLCNLHDQIRLYNMGMDMERQFPKNSSHIIHDHMARFSNSGKALHRYHSHYCFLLKDHGQTQSVFYQFWLPFSVETFWKIQMQQLISGNVPLIFSCEMRIESKKQQVFFGIIQLIFSCEMRIESKKQQVFFGIIPLIFSDKSSNKSKIMTSFFANSENHSFF